MKNITYFYNISKSISSIVLVIVLCFCLTYQSDASFYEVNVKISWHNKPMSSIKAYLLSNTISTAPDSSFTADYAVLKEKQAYLRTLTSSSERAEQNRQEKQLTTDFKKLIVKYTLHRISVPRSGEINLNVDPETDYYLVIIKKSGMFKLNPDLLFWINNFRIESGAVMEPKTILFNENNVKFW